ncbi:MAG: AAA family ATPase [Bacteroidaceae bacterium]|nr:AAA family ATPase [Bacteroidaceae bacterium]
MEEGRRRYPIGIQTFERMRREGYVYIDKTNLVWRMAQVSPYVFLSRPRRFGKSLLTSTLKSYFQGEREFFQGLRIMQLELKTRGTVQEALLQIDHGDYGLPYQTEGYRVVKAGLVFDIESRSLKEWCVDGKE